MPDTQTSCRSGWRVHLADDVAVLDEGGQVLTLRSRKGRALLAFLASAKNHESSRAIQIGLLWSDRGHDQARASLRQCLFEIRSEADGLIIVDGERIALDFVVHGQVSATHDPATLGVRVETRNGLLLWSETREASHDDLAAAAAAIATRLGMVMTCALNGPRGIKRAPEVLAALMNACDKIDPARPNYDNEDMLVATRRFVARAPGDPVAHAMLGMGLVLTSEEMPPSVARAALIESERELKRAIELDPRAGTAWLGLGTGLLFRHEFARAEAMYAHGLAVEPDEQFLNSFMSELLSEVGRTEEALVYARRAVAISPAALALTANLAERLAWSGEPRAAIDILDAADAAHPKSALLVGSRLSILIRTGDLAGARALLDRAARIPGLMESAQEAQLRRLIETAEHPDNPKAQALAREAVEQAKAQPGVSYIWALTLASLGRTDAALTLAERFPVASAFFAMPQPNPMLLSPRFPAAARRAGLWDYWVSTGHWPDICRDPKLQWKCGTVKSASIQR